MDEELALARRLCGGRAAPVKLTRLAGGRNNRVYRVELADGDAVVLKRYFHHPSDTRDRLNAEWSFLNHAWTRGVRTIAQPLAKGAGDHAGLYAFVPGRAPEAGTRALVDAAAAFVCAVNAEPRNVSMLPAGSEACFSLRQHLDLIGGRVARLARIAEDAPHREEAQALVEKRLRPAWAKVAAGIESGAADAVVALDRELGEAEVIASPSDFGFHNTLLGEDGVLRFIDFEYAGRDDPAKLCGDFYGVPAIPAPPETFGTFVDALAHGLKLGDAFRKRARLLRDAYRIKWMCIALNDFLPVQNERRAFASGDERAKRCARQLERAGQMLDALD